jgi:hypothetical protein
MFKKGDLDDYYFNVREHVGRGDELRQGAAGLIQKA